VKTGAAALTAILLFAAGAAQADSPSEHAIAEGRYHLRKANGLAGDDRCQAAVHEYTLAYKKLHDPVVLFNRAECYRRIGEDEKAIADYRAFLEAAPAAPNRVQIEAKIAALHARLWPVAGPAPVRPSGPGPERATAPPPVRPLATVPPSPAVEPAPTIADTSTSAPLSASASPPAVALVPTEASASASPSPSPDGEGHHGKTWLWLAVGAAVAGGAVGAYFALRTPATVPPTTDLGNYKF
jgi:hypothetical protein